MKARFSAGLLLAALLFGTATTNSAQADTFGSGANQFDIEFVPIDNPGNPADTTGSRNPAGSVDYAFRMGKFEISEDMIDKANALGGLGITKDSRSPDKPATDVSWFEAAMFVNWLNMDAGFPVAYKFDLNGDFHLWAPGDLGYNPSNLYRNRLAKYVLPNSDEWYKAAYYDPNASLAPYYTYPTGSNTAPTAVASGTTANTAVYNQPINQGPADITLAGGLSPYGTMGQGGNVQEWQETSFDLLNNDVSSDRDFRGGDWNSPFPSSLGRDFRFSTAPEDDFGYLGFRVASIPEPSTVLLAALAGLGFWVSRRR